MNEHKNKLIELINDGGYAGITQKIKFKHSKLYSYITNLKKDNDLTFSESIYWIINDISSKPICPNPNHNSKCQSIVRFKGVLKGYSKYCKSCFVKITYTPRSKETINKMLKRSKETNLKKYGAEYPISLDMFKQKQKQTLLNNYPKGMANEEITKRKIETNKKKYGKEWALQSKEVIEKRNQSSLIKYGAISHMKTKEYQTKFSNQWYKKYGEDFFINMKKILKSKNLKLINYTTSHDQSEFKCLKCNNGFKDLWNSIQQGKSCPICFPIKPGSSIEEQKISEFIRSLGIELITGDRKLINPYELDIYIPSKKLAIEYCGLYYHSTFGKDLFKHVDKTYHLNKLKLCNQKNIKLLTIFEDEWILQNEKVKNKIKSNVGTSSDQTTIRASKCTVREVLFNDKKIFIDKYHIQNDRISQINIGLYHSDLLVAVMTFNYNKKYNFYELLRYCTHSDYKIHGGAGKLLKYFKTTHKWDMIMTYADKRWSDGNMYKLLGFELVSETEPNYWYWGNNIIGRKHRLHFTKSKLKQIPEIYQENKTELEMMIDAGFYRIYDCGNMRFEMKNTDQISINYTKIENDGRNYQYIKNHKICTNKLPKKKIKQKSTKQERLDLLTVPDPIIHMNNKCKLCGKINNGRKGLSSHIRQSHLHEISLKEYYDKYIEPIRDPICPVCKKFNKSFISFSYGYSKTCLNQIDPITNKKMTCRAIWANRDKEKLKRSQKKNMEYMKNTISKQDPTKTIYEIRKNKWYKTMTDKDENGKTKFEKIWDKRRENNK